MPKKVGRPKVDKSKAKSRIVTLRLTDEEYERLMFDVPIDYAGNTSEFIRKLLHYYWDNGIRIT